MFTISVLFAYAEPSGESIPAEDDNIHYYRTLLSDEEQLLYDALLDCALSDDPSERGEEIRITEDPAEEEFKLMFRKSYNALIYDHPELFWLSVSNSAFQFSYRRQLFNPGYFKVAFQITGDFPVRDAQMKALDEAAEELLSEIDLSDPDPIVALQIHDKLIDLVTYDKDAAELFDKDLAHTAYGALVENTSGYANTAVCDGYAYAYEYLLQKAGIRSAIVAGMAGETEETAEATPGTWSSWMTSGTRLTPPGMIFPWKRLLTRKRSIARSPKRRCRTSGTRTNSHIFCSM